MFSVYHNNDFVSHKYKNIWILVWLQDGNSLDSLIDLNGDRWVIAHQWTRHYHEIMMKKNWIHAFFVFLNVINIMYKIISDFWNLTG